MGYCQSCDRRFEIDGDRCPACGDEMMAAAPGARRAGSTSVGPSPVEGDPPSPGAPAAKPASARDLSAGTDVGGYIVEGKLGEGGMGSVYAAVHPDIGKKAAIKVISHTLCRDDHAVQRFKQEARAVNQIGHPNIVDVFAFGELDDGRSYFVMEWLQGESLGDLAERNALALPEVLNVLDQIADALDAAHENAIVHRDLKPDNVVVEDVRGQLRVKLLDFGIAKLANPTDDAPIAQTQTGMMMGTPGYISPEQARGRGVDHRTDIYALGSMTYELVLGRLPFDADNAMDMVMAHLTKPPPRMSEAWPEVPPVLEDIVLRMMAKDVASRPALGEVRAALAAAHEQAVELAGPARDSIRESFRPRLQTPVGQTSPSPTAAGIDTDSMDLDRPPRSRAPLFIGGVVALCAIAGAAFALSGGSSSEGPPAPATAAAPAEPVAPAPTPAAASPEPASAGTLTVVVNVAGATVAVDGEVIAESVRRARLDIAEAGRHEIRVTAPGYAPFTAAVQIADGAAIEVAANLQKKAAGKAQRRRAKRRRAKQAAESAPEPKKPKRKRKGDYTLDPFAE